MILKGAVILLAFSAIWATLVWAMLLASKEDDDEYFSDLTPEEIAEERSRYACYEDTDIES